MFRQVTSYCLVAGAATLIVFAQAPATAPAPGQAAAAGGTQAGRGGGRGALVSPQVNADKTITLSFRLPTRRR